MHSDVDFCVAVCRWCPYVFHILLIFMIVTMLCHALDKIQRLRDLLVYKDSVVHVLIQLVQAVIVRPLSSVSALVRFAEEPQMFAVEFNDGCPIHVSPCCILRFQSYRFLMERVKKLTLIYDPGFRFMLAPLVIAYLQQFWMFCKLK